MASVKMMQAVATEGSSNLRMVGGRDGDHADAIDVDARLRIRIAAEDDPGKQSYTG